jgi:hypothetical protein
LPFSANDLARDGSFVCTWLTSGMSHGPPKRTVLTAAWTTPPATAASAGPASRRIEERYATTRATTVAPVTATPTEARVSVHIDEAIAAPLAHRGAGVISIRNAQARAARASVNAQSSVSWHTSDPAEREQRWRRSDRQQQDRDAPAITVALVMAIYLGIGLRDDSPVQAPERLYREPSW